MPFLVDAYAIAHTPRATYRNTMPSRSKGYSRIPVVGVLTHKTSCNVGKNPGSITL